MPPFRNDLDAAEAREKKLQGELKDAAKHAEELRAKQDESDARAKEEERARRGPPWYRRKRLLGFPFMVFFVFVLVPSYGKCRASASGYRAVVLEALNNCPRAKEALGDDIHFNFTGVACGGNGAPSDVRTSSGADWRLPVSGSRASGAYHFKAQDNGDGWFIRSGRVEVGDKTISLTRCHVDPDENQGLYSKELSDALEILSAPVEETTLGAVLQECEDGAADICLSLSQLYARDGELDLEQLFLRKACDLGNQEACNKRKPQTETPPLGD